jgi:hypothetical protein
VGWPPRRKTYEVPRTQVATERNAIHRSTRFKGTYEDISYRSTTSYIKAYKGLHHTKARAKQAMGDVGGWLPQEEG